MSDYEEHQDHSIGYNFPESTSFLGDDRQSHANFEDPNEIINSEPIQNSQSIENASTEQPPVEHFQSLFYTKGLEELESLQLLDLSPLATWKLSSHKQGHGLRELREDNPDSFWQSDGSIENNIEHQPNNESANLNHPHFIMIQFSKKVSLERISIFTNYQLDESYTPSKIKIMAGGSNWDLTEVCVVNFEKPTGWSHIIFKGVREDGLLKCFVVKIIILANHQDGKDSHIRAVRCFGKKSNTTFIDSLQEPTLLKTATTRQANSSNASFFNSSLSLTAETGSHRMMPIEDEDHSEDVDELYDQSTLKILNNVRDVLGFNQGFESLELKSISSIR